MKFYSFLFIINKHLKLTFILMKFNKARMLFFLFNTTIPNLCISINNYSVMLISMFFLIPYFYIQQISKHKTSSVHSGSIQVTMNWL